MSSKPMPVYDHRKDKDKRSSFLDKVGGTFKGKKATKSSVSSFKTPMQEDLAANGDGNEYASPTQAIHNLSELELGEKFEQMLDDMNLTDEKKDPLRGMDLATKRRLLAMHCKGSARPKGSMTDSPQLFIQELRNSDLKPEKRCKLLESLRVSLTSNTVSWVQEFGVEGLKVILKNLTYCCDKNERRSMYECVRCLKAYMNNKFGLRQIIEHEEALTILARTMDPSDPITMLEAVRLLAAICLVPPDGHEKVLDGITVFGDIRQQNRFDTIINGMGMRDNQQMQVACIQLINALVSTPDDLDFRVHLRNEIMRTGLIELIPSLEATNDEELKTHLSIFETHKEQDAMELSERFDNIHIELNDVREVFELVYQTVVNSVAEPYFLSILQHLVSIRDDVYARPQYYKLIEECVTQIVLHKTGVDPDFRYTKRFEIDVEPLLSSLTEVSNIEDSVSGHIPVGSKHEAALTAKQEAEARATSLEEKLKLVEQELATLKEGMKDGISSVVSANIATRGGPPAPPPPPGMGGPPPPPPPPPGMGGPPAPPPPPPPPGMGGPPPPPPPPGMGPPPPPGLGGPPPPPPPGMGGPRPPGPPGGPPPIGPGFMAAPANELPPGMAPKKKYNVSTQLKRTNWNKINGKTISKNSFWMNVHEDDYASEDLFQQLIENFSTQMKEKKTEEEKEVKKVKGKDFKVLDPKSGQNLSILLGSIKVPYTEIRRRIVEMDEETLTPGMLEQLIKFIPAPEQMKQLEALKDQYTDLAEPEQFTVVMSKIKRITPRLKSMLFKMKFPELVNDIKPELVSAMEALEEIRSSTKLARILEIILLMGNYMNTGSRNAQSLGFEISYLAKIQNTKTTDNKSTLMHFLARVVEEKYPDVISFHDEMPHLDSASRMSDENVSKNIKSMEKSIKQLDIDIKNMLKDADPNDRFNDVMTDFISHAQTQCDVLNGMYKKLSSLLKDMSLYYCFDPKKYTLEDMLGDLVSFKNAFQTAVKENRKLRETEEKIKRAKEAKEKAAREKQEKMARKKALVDMSTDDAQEGVMDNLLEALKTGTAFSVNREKREVKKRTPRAAGAERRAQLAKSRSRQNLVDNSVVQEINFDDSPIAPPRNRRGSRPISSEVSEAEQLLERLKAL